MMGAIFQMHSSTSEMEVRRQDPQLVAEFQMRMEGKLISDTITFFPFKTTSLPYILEVQLFSRNPLPALNRRCKIANKYRLSPGEHDPLPAWHYSEYLQFTVTHRQNMTLYHRLPPLRHIPGFG